MNKKKFLKGFLEFIVEFLKAVLAGISISIGALAFLSAENKTAGSLFFTIGLFLVLFFDFNLFTGKVCFSLDQKPKYIFNLIVIWIGNFCGALLAGGAFSLTRLDYLSQKCMEICETKLNDSLLSVFVLAIFCNLLIFVAVYGYKKADESWKKVLALFFGVSVFVLCGFEHCVADMFYFVFGGVLSGKILLYLLVITCGNIIGGLLLPVLLKIFDRAKENVNIVEKKENVNQVHQGNKNLDTKNQDSEFRNKD